MDPPYLVTVVLYRYDSNGKWYGSHCFTMEEAPTQICTISGMVAALRNHDELWPKQTAKFSFMDERGIMVPLTCDRFLFYLLCRYWAVMQQSCFFDRKRRKVRNMTAGSVILLPEEGKNGHFAARRR